MAALTPSDANGCPQSGRRGRPGLDELLGRMQAFLCCRARNEEPSRELHEASYKFYQEGTRLIIAVLHRRGILRRPLVEDLVQDVWTEVLRSLPSFRWRRSGCVSVWLGRIAGRRAARHWEKAARQSIEPLTDVELDCMGGGEPNPGNTAQRQEGAAIVRDEVDKLRGALSNENQAILDGYTLGDRRATEVADELDIREATVHDRARWIRKKLRHKLHERGIKSPNDLLVQ